MSETLMTLAKLLLPSDASLMKEVELAINNSTEYLINFEEQLSGRGIEEACPDLPWIALVNGLSSRERLVELDWKFAVEDTIWNIDTLFTAASLPPVQWDWVEIEGWQDELPSEFLKAANDHLAKRGLLIIYLDIDSDSYPITVIQTAQFQEAERLAREAGYNIISDTRENKDN